MDQIFKGKSSFSFPIRGISVLLSYLILVLPFFFTNTTPILLEDSIKKKNTKNLHFLEDRVDKCQFWPMRCK